MKQAKSPEACAPAVIWVSLLALVTMIVAFARNSRAEGLSGYLEYNYAINKTHTVDADGRSSRTDGDARSQLYNITLDKGLYPNLRLFASGFFKRMDDSLEQSGVKNEITTTTFYPYVSLNLKTPLYRADVSYGWREEKVESSLFSPFTIVREFALSTLYWKPDRYPDLKLQFSRENSYDKDRSTLDTTTDVFQITSNYRPSDPLVLYYQGTYRNTELGLSGTTTEEMSHNGRVNYNNGWWNRRITLGVDYNIRVRDIETQTTGAGEVGFQVFPFFGLSALSDTPGIVVLGSNPALIDGNFAAGAGINLGLPPPGANTSLRNLGLDFVGATEINTLYVWVDRDVSLVDDTASCEIYTSGDNQNWVPGQTVAPAIYSPTFNRFEIRFQNVNARYVKVVAAPLAPTVPFASSFPDILVTEIQAEIRRPASQVSGKSNSTFQTGNVDFRAVLLESIALTYELTYFFKNADPGDFGYTVSNGVSFFRQFDQVFSGRGRVAYEYADEPAGLRESIIYTASVTAVPIQTLFHSLTLSGREETFEGKKYSEGSILLYNNAKLYQGIDTNLSAGTSFREEDAGVKTSSYFATAGATFVPNQKMVFNLLYDGNTTSSSGGNLKEETTSFTRAGEANLTITPVPTVFLYGSYRLEYSSDFPNRSIWNYSLSWSPFPDGTLKLSFYYNDTIRSDDLRYRSINPSLQWYFMPRSYLQLSYQNNKTEGPTQTVTSDLYTGTVRIAF